MRILLVNKFYYPRGGDCIVVLGTEQLLKSKGHEVAVFSMRHPLNLPSPWESYFPSEISFSGAGIRAKMRAASRLFAPREVAKAFASILDDFRPDVVHLHNIHSYLSPVVANVARKKGVSLVWTMHDYKLICPAYNCLRNGRPCELCFRSKFPVLKHRCMKNSRAASLLAWMEAAYWNRRKLERLTDCFISPSLFLKEKMTAAGFNPERIAVLPNFTDIKAPACTSKEDYYCYVGRLSAEKGIDLLLNVASQLPYRLKVIGGGKPADDLKQYPQHIEFMGQMPHEQLLPVVQRARFSVMPSICYDNNPLSIIESLCLGTPVIGARIGGIPELIVEGVNGALFEAGNPESLEKSIKQAWTMPFPYQEMAAQAQERFSPDRYYERLLTCIIIIYKFQKHIKMKNIVQGSLITTFRCNAKCNMCNIWNNPTRKTEEIDYTYYEKLPAGLRINITGGEATIREDIDDIFRILYPKASLLELSTNGYHTEKIVALANKYPKILIRVSLEGLPALNDAKRGIKNGFDHALRTMLELKKSKCKNIGFSVVISPDNYKDLIHLYDLCVALEVELGNSVVHNSWYFHKNDNRIVSEEALHQHDLFVKALLTSKRRGLKNKLKDYARAFFNKSIHQRLRGDKSGYRPPCGALDDFFFIDPWGNVTPCNGSEEEWIIGNIKEDSFENIMSSEKAKEMGKRVKACDRNCAFVVTERHDMLRRPWIPILWIIRNKIRIARGKDIQW